MLLFWEPHLGIPSHTRRPLECRRVRMGLLLSFLTAFLWPASLTRSNQGSWGAGRPLRGELWGGLLDLLHPVVHSKGENRQEKVGALHLLLSGGTGRPHNGVRQWPTWRITGIPGSYLMHRRGYLLYQSRHFGVLCTLLSHPFCKPWSYCEPKPFGLAHSRLCVSGALTTE